jgi:hypothetical protein
VGIFAAEACSDAALALETAGRESNFGAAQESWFRLKLEMQRLVTALGERVGGKATCDSL